MQQLLWMKRDPSRNVIVTGEWSCLGSFRNVRFDRTSIRMIAHGRQGGISISDAHVEQCESLHTIAAVYYWTACVSHSWSGRRHVILWSQTRTLIDQVVFKCLSVDCGTVWTTAFLKDTRELKKCECGGECAWEANTQEEHPLQPRPNYSNATRSA